MVCSSSMKYLFINGLVFALMILVSSTNTTTVESINQSNCTKYRACRQCVHISTCSWLLNGQRCVYATSQLEKSEYLIKKYENECPKFEVLSQKSTSGIGILYVLQIVNDKFLKFLNSHKLIECKVNAKLFKADLTIENINITKTNTSTIICDFKNLLNQNYLKNEKKNALNILYVSIFVNKTKLQFDNAKDQYISYYSHNSENCFLHNNCVDSYWENESNKYYCKWCINDNNNNCKLNECDIRHLNNNTKIINNINNIEIQSAEFEISSSKTTIEMTSSRLNINITVNNNKYLMTNNTTLNITIAGVNCEYLELYNISRTNGIITCEISQKFNTTIEGPVKIVYSKTSSQFLNFTLKSNQMFRLVVPEIHSFSPKCGSLSGNTLINIEGQGFNIFNNVYINGTKKIPCPVVKYESNRIQCTTSVSNKIDSGLLIVTFNKTTINTFSPFWYVDKPSASPDQHYEGIESGGTRLSVRGNFHCIQNPKMFVIDHFNNTHIFSDCNSNDTTMDRDANIITCITPTIFESNSMMKYRIGLTVKFSGEDVIILSPDNTANHYVLYPDPVFIDFVVNGTMVTLNGEFAYTNYQPSELTVKIHETNEKCEVKTVINKSIVCQMSYEVKNVTLLIIKVGTFLSKTARLRNFESNTEANTITSTVINNYTIVTMFVTLLLIFCIITIRLIKSRKPSKKRYIKELQNITAGIDEKLL